MVDSNFAEKNHFSLYTISQSLHSFSLELLQIMKSTLKEWDEFYGYKWKDNHTAVTNRYVLLQPQVDEILNDFQRKINLYNRICNIPFHTRVSNTPLHMACIFSLSEKGDLDPRDNALVCLEVTMALIKLGADIDARNGYQSTPLHLACIYRRIEVAMALIEKGAAIDVKNRWQFTPQCTQTMTDLFNRLWRSTPLLTAMHSNDMDAFQTLLNDDTYDVNEDVSTNGDGWTILHAAASLNLNVNRMEYVNLLLQSPRIDVLAVTNSKSYTALHIACDRNDAEFARAMNKEQRTKNKNLNGVSFPCFLND